MASKAKAGPPQNYAYRSFFDKRETGSVLTTSLGKRKVGRPPSIKPIAVSANPVVDLTSPQAQPESQTDCLPTQIEQPNASATPEAVAAPDVVAASIEAASAAPEVAQEESHAPARKRAKRDNFAAWMRYFEAVAADPAASSAVVKRVRCIACSTSGKDCIVLDNLDTLQKHCGIKLLPDGTYVPRGSKSISEHQLNVHRYERDRHRKDLGTMAVAGYPCVQACATLGRMAMHTTRTCKCKDSIHALDTRHAKVTALLRLHLTQVCMQVWISQQPTSSS